MSASLRAGNSSDGYLQVDNADIVAITSSGMTASSGKTLTANAVATDKAYRVEATTDNDLSFDLSARNNFTCTPTGNGTLTFTNIAGQAGQSGYIKLVNGSNYTISAHANTKVTSSFLTTVSATGTYIISYYNDGTDVHVSTGGASA